MNSLYALKPFITALLMPPTSLLLMLGACLAWRRTARWTRPVAAALLVLLWLSACQGSGRWLVRDVLRPPAALDRPALAALAAGSGGPSTAVIVLGAGRYGAAPEFLDQPDLTPNGLARLRYGMWLSRQLQQPLGYSGGVGWAQKDGPSEADAAARIVRDEWGGTLRWAEGRSRDTRENADFSVPLLRADGVRRIVLVTHAWHMPRALAHFRRAAGSGIEVVAAPFGFPGEDERSLLDWIPSTSGVLTVQWVVRELLGRAAGA